MKKNDKTFSAEAGNVRRAIPAVLPLYALLGVLGGTILSDLALIILQYALCYCALETVSGLPLRS